MRYNYQQKRREDKMKNDDMFSEGLFAPAVSL
jgi:hypothetical protein